MYAERVKIVRDITDLVAVLRCFDVSIKKKVYEELTKSWLSSKDIKKKYGSEGLDALTFFEKMKFVDVRWEITPKGPIKVYHSHYTSFLINVTVPINEIEDVLQVATMSEKKISKYEKNICKLVTSKGSYIGDVAKSLNITETMLKSMIKRSLKLECRGQRIERVLK